MIKAILHFHLTSLNFNEVDFRQKFDLSLLIKVTHPSLMCIHHLIILHKGLGELKELKELEGFDGLKELEGFDGLKELREFDGMVMQSY